MILDSFRDPDGGDPEDIPIQLAFDIGDLAADEAASTGLVLALGRSTDDADAAYQAGVDFLMGSGGG